MQKSALKKLYLFESYGSQHWSSFLAHHATRMEKKFCGILWKMPKKATKSRVYPLWVRDEFWNVIVEVNHQVVIPICTQLLGSLIDGDEGPCGTINDEALLHPLLELENTIIPDSYPYAPGVETEAELILRDKGYCLCLSLMKILAELPSLKKT
uniref:Uncharacterized protein n=1 Tax=Romanomermis culicivorax TaxID=13658 RepID=A0A915KWY4_ROMCU